MAVSQVKSVSAGGVVEGPGDGAGWDGSEVASGGPADADGDAPGPGPASKDPVGSGLPDGPGDGARLAALREGGAPSPSPGSIPLWKATKPKTPIRATAAKAASTVLRGVP